MDPRQKLRTKMTHYTGQFEESHSRIQPKNKGSAVSAEQHSTWHSSCHWSFSWSCTSRDASSCAWVALAILNTYPTVSPSLCTGGPTVHKLWVICLSDGLVQQVFPNSTHYVSLIFTYIHVDPCIWLKMFQNNSFQGWFTVQNGLLVHHYDRGRHCFFTKSSRIRCKAMMTACLANPTRLGNQLEPQNCIYIM